MTSGYIDSLWRDTKSFPSQSHDPKHISCVGQYSWYINADVLYTRQDAVRFIIVDRLVNNSESPWIFKLSQYIPRGPG